MYGVIIVVAVMVVVVMEMIDINERNSRTMILLDAMSCKV